MMEEEGADSPDSDQGRLDALNDAFNINHVDQTTNCSAHLWLRYFTSKTYEGNICDNA